MSTGRGLAALGFATAGVLYAAAFTVWAVFAPLYSSGETLLDVNPEPIVRVAVATPLAVACGLWLLLHVACRTGANWARASAWTVVALLCAFCLVTGFSIGLFVLPAAGLLVLATALTP